MSHKQSHEARLGDLSVTDCTYQLQVELTTRCNLRCIYCVTLSADHRRENLNPSLSDMLKYLHSRITPLPNPGGRESKEAYFDYQYRATEHLYAGLYSCHIDFVQRNILDLGCGMGGGTAWYVANTGCASIIGVDRDEYSLSVARRETLRMPVRCPVQFQQTASDVLPCADESFDISFTRLLERHGFC